MFFLDFFKKYRLLLLLWLFSGSIGGVAYLMLPYFTSNLSEKGAVLFQNIQKSETDLFLNVQFCDTRTGKVLETISDKEQIKKFVNILKNAYKSEENYQKRLDRYYLIVNTIYGETFHLFLYTHRYPDKLIDIELIEKSNNSTWYLYHLTSTSMSEWLNVYSTEESGEPRKRNRKRRKGGRAKLTD